MEKTNLTEWLMVVIFSGAIIIIWYLIKRYLDNNQENQKESTIATKALTESNIHLAEKLNSFREHCSHIEASNTNRLNSHSGDIGELKGDVIRIDTTVQEHSKRLTRVEDKIK